MSEQNAVIPKRTGVVLVNVGTPDSPAVGDVRRYLREFLSDARVLTMPRLARWLLVNFIIVPFRGPKSAHAYKSIWTERGSPLLTHGLNLAAAAQEILGAGYVVRLGMRYGNPDLRSVVTELLDSHKVDEIVIAPLYPQYSSSATGAAIERINEILAERAVIPATRVIGDFFDDDGFIGAVSDIAREKLAPFKADHVLMSYHGLPESHVKATTGNFCLSEASCCNVITTKNRFCYRAQCFATSRQLAKTIGLSKAEYTVSFQSRLGRTPWIQPFTDKILADIYATGARRLAVMVPSFVADCLETIEEIGDRARADWKALGGEDFLLIPCVNSHPRWVNALAAMIRRG